MTTRLIFKLLSMAAIGLILSLSGCARYNYNPMPVNTNTYYGTLGCDSCAHEAYKHVVRIENHMFNPQVIEIMKGQRVVWVNYDNVPHTVTSSNGTFNSGTIAPGAKYVRAFNHRGTYNYYCKFHPEMKAVVVVH